MSDKAIPLNATENVRGKCFEQLGKAKQFMLIYSDDGKGWALMGSYMEDDLPSALGHVLRLTLNADIRKQIAAVAEQE